MSSKDVKGTKKVVQLDKVEEEKEEEEEEEDNMPRHINFLSNRIIALVSFGIITITKKNTWSGFRNQFMSNIWFQPWITATSKWF